VAGLVKRFGAVEALAGIDVTVEPGSILAVLGHNGAGKTTLVDILSTRARPSAGHASVGGFDVVRSARQVRRRIGVTGQFAALDDAVSLGRISACSHGYSVPTDSRPGTVPTS